jgi:hypothetical protein
MCQVGHQVMTCARMKQEILEHEVNVLFDVVVQRQTQIYILDDDIIEEDRDIFK